MYNVNIKPLTLKTNDNKENEINETDQLKNNQDSVILDKITYPVKMELQF